MAPKLKSKVETFQDRLTAGRLKVKDLVPVHEFYTDMISEWTLLLAVYEGLKEIKKKGYIKKHEREYSASYARRMDELYGLDYTSSIVNIFHFYLFKKPPQHKFGSLGKDELWTLFMKDADLFRNSFEAVIMDLTLYASIFGCVGVLVDKADMTSLQKAKPTKKDEIDNKIYPYIAKYFPTNILDWSFSRDQFNRPYLSYVKLLDDDGVYRIWTTTEWQKWELPKNSEGHPDKSNQEAVAVLLGSGTHGLGLIPFFWHYNKTSRRIGVGKSDVHAVARLDLSIIRNLSQIEEIIGFAAYPMMLKPQRSVRPGDVAVQQEDETGPEVVLEFDPDKPDSKPGWLTTEVDKPIQVIVEFVAKKAEEIYRATNTGGLTATDTNSRSSRSGVALKSEFQLLNSQLVAKGMNVEITEEMVVDLWLRWQGELEKYQKEVELHRDRTYDVEDLATDLENLVVSKTVVMSERFNKILQKRTARKMLPGVSEEDLNKIDEEIELYKEPEPPEFEDMDIIPPVKGKGGEEEGGTSGNPFDDLSVKGEE